MDKDSFVINNIKNIDVLFIFGFNNLDYRIINKIKDFTCNTIIFNDHTNTSNNNIDEIFNDTTINDATNKSLINS